MWVYGYGSLMWDRWEEEFNCKRRLIAELKGYRRILNKASVVNWGTKERPCPTLNIEVAEGATCIGIAFEFDEQARNEINAYLSKREGKNFELRPLTVTAQEVGPFEAIVPLYTGKNIIAEGDLVSTIRATYGSSGTCVEYITRVHTQLVKLGINDLDISALLEAVRGEPI